MNTKIQNDIAQAIYLATKDKSGSHLTGVSKKIALMLKKRRMLSRAEEILFRLRKIMNQENGVTEAKITSRAKLLDSERKTLEEFLKKRHSAQEILLEESLDDSLLGGFRIESNGEVIDLSLRNKLKKLKTHLTKSV